jgi:short subunit dehydrogenase-like uncharacterized protein
MFALQKLFRMLIYELLPQLRSEDGQSERGRGSCGMKDIKMEPIKRYCFKSHMPQMEFADGYAQTQMIMDIVARVEDLRDKAVVDACVAAAREAGIHELYLLDKKFVIDALKEKLRNVNEHENYCPNCGAKMDGGADG